MNAALIQRFAPPPIVPQQPVPNGWVEVGSVSSGDKEVVVEDKQVQTESSKTDLLDKNRNDERKAETEMEAEAEEEEEEDQTVRGLEECMRIHDEVRFDDVKGDGSVERDVSPFFVLVSYRAELRF